MCVSQILKSNNNTTAVVTIKGYVLETINLSRIK